MAGAAGATTAVAQPGTQTGNMLGNVMNASPTTTGVNQAVAAPAIGGGSGNTWANPFAGSGRTWADATDSEIQGQLSGKYSGDGTINYGYYGPKEISRYRSSNGSNLMDGTTANPVAQPNPLDQGKYVGNPNHGDFNMSPAVQPSGMQGTILSQGADKDEGWMANGQRGMPGGIADANGNIIPNNQGAQQRPITNMPNVPGGFGSVPRPQQPAIPNTQPAIPNTGGYADQARDFMPKPQQPGRTQEWGGTAVTTNPLDQGKYVGNPNHGGMPFTDPNMTVAPPAPGYKGNTGGGMPSWMNAPADGSMNTMATQQHTNPVTGETWMANSGGFSVKPTYDGGSFSQHSGKSYAVDPNNPNNYIGKYRDDYALQPSDPGYAYGGPAPGFQQPGRTKDDAVLPYATDQYWKDVGEPVIDRARYDADQARDFMPKPPSDAPLRGFEGVARPGNNQGGGKGGSTGPQIPEQSPVATPYAGRPATQNINTQSAEGITNAMQGTQAEMGYRPQQVNVPGTSSSIGGVNQSTRIGNPGQSGTVGGVNQSAQVQAGQLSGTNYDPYMNPYTDAVIKSTEGDILRGGEKQLTGLGSQASSAGAFGGSRHGIAMGEVGRNITEQMAKSSTGLRQANFQQAQNAAQQDITGRMQAGVANQQASQFDIGNVRQQQMANQQASQFDIGNKLKAGQLNQQASQFDIGNVRQAQLANQTAGMQDIQNMMNAQQYNQSAGLQGSQNRQNAASQLGNLSNMGFGMGQTVQGNLANQGTQQQVMMQALIDAAKGQYGGYTGAPAAGLGYVTQALGATGTPTSTTGSSSPGLFDYLTTGASIYAASDKRLKKNITKMGQLKSGLNIYKWEWREGAKELGADMNHTLGVIAQEAKELFPNAVVKMDNGYYAVNYSALR